jgi:hypothetical protein
MVFLLNRLAAFFLITAILGLHSGYAAEIDSVTSRRIHLADSRNAINAIFNQRMLEGITKANARRDDFEALSAEDFCDEEILYTELRKSIFQSFIVSWGLKGYDLDKQLRELLADRSYSLALNDSIYRDIDYIEGISLNMKELSDVVRFNNHLVGLDKLGHFFAEGWQYFEFSQEEGYSLKQAILWGKEQESGKYGYSTTGIFSFADLVANFNGWRFWNRVLGKSNDPLLGFIQNLLDEPYVSCDIQVVASIRHLKLVKAWERNKQIDMSEYIDGAWDEGNNCNSYADPVIEEKVSSRIREVDPQFSCPINPQFCVEAREKYGRFGKYILHPYCLGTREKSVSE